MLQRILRLESLNVGIYALAPLARISSPASKILLIGSNFCYFDLQIHKAHPRGGECAITLLQSQSLAVEQHFPSLLGAAEGYIGEAIAAAKCVLVLDLKQFLRDSYSSETGAVRKGVQTNGLCSDWKNHVVERYAALEGSTPDFDKFSWHINHFKRPATFKRGFIDKPHIVGELHSLKGEAVCERIEFHKYAGVGNGHLGEVEAEGKRRCADHINRLGELQPCERGASLKGTLAKPLNRVGNDDFPERITGGKCLIENFLKAVIQNDLFKIFASREGAGGDALYGLWQSHALNCLESAEGVFANLHHTFGYNKIFYFTRVLIEARVNHGVFLGGIFNYFFYHFVILASA